MFSRNPPPEYSSGLSHQGLTGQNPRAVADIVAKLEMIRRQYDDSRAVLEPSEFIALAHAGLARENGRSAARGIEHDIEEMQPDAGYQNGGDRHQGQDFARCQASPDDRALVLAEQPLDALERDR